MINIVKFLYDNALMQVRLGDKLTNDIVVTQGVLQGEVFIPLLFILYLADITTFFEKQGLEGISKDKSAFLFLLYANNIVMLIRSETHLREGLQILEENCKSKGMMFNVDKTKAMRVSLTDKGCCKYSPFHFNGKVIELVKSYTYLDVVIYSNIRGTASINYAISNSRLASNTVLSILAKLKGELWVGKSMKIQLPAKFEFD